MFPIFKFNSFLRCNKKFLKIFICSFFGNFESNIEIVIMVRKFDISLNS